MTVRDIRLYIERYGNLGGDGPKDTYSGHGETEAAEKIVSLTDFGNIWRTPSEFNPGMLFD